MSVHALRLSHWNWAHPRLPRLALARPKVGSGSEIGMELCLMILGALLGWLLFVPGVLH